MAFLDYTDIAPREIAPGFFARFVHTPGMVAFIPGAVPHSARALTACEVLDVWHPVREDYR